MNCIERHVRELLSDEKLIAIITDAVTSMVELCDEGQPEPPIIPAKKFTGYAWEDSDNPYHRGQSYIHMPSKYTKKIKLCTVNDTAFKFDRDLPRPSRLELWYGPEKNKFKSPITIRVKLKDGTILADVIKDTPAGKVVMGNYRGVEDSKNQVIYRFPKPGGEYPNGLKLVYFGPHGIERKTITNTSHESSWWRPKSHSETPAFRGKLVVKLKGRDICNVYKGFHLTKGQHKKCWLEV
jgi:hypothetical protein